MKTAIWAAVSTKTQASEDKASIPVQLEKGTEYIHANGHTLTGQYIAPGESRTHYISLAHAEASIPQLKQLLDDASKGKFDLLWVYDLNRFRVLMLQVFDALAGYGIQIYNSSSPEPPVEPHQYSAEVINARRLTVQLHDIISRQETNKLQKHHSEKMPRRVTEKHLHPGLGLPPYAYRKPPGREHDRNAVLEIAPEQARTLIQIKDWFLFEGMSLTAITQRLNAANIPSPRGKRWWFSIVRYLLANPFYCGIVQYGITKRTRDRRLITVTRTKGANPVRAAGLHTPLWDQSTHQRILGELQRRANAQPGISIRAFTRLLTCQCGCVLWAQVTPAGQYWRCSTMQSGHTYINNAKALDLIIPEIVRALQNINTISFQTNAETNDLITKQIADLHKKEKRILDLYEDEIIDKATLNARLEDIKTRLSRAESELATQEQSATRKRILLTDLQAMQKSIATLPAYIRQAPPAKVNATLHRLFSSIQICKDHKIKISWRL